MEQGLTAGWIEAYIAAWESNDPDDIRALFTEGARYYSAPYRPPWVGQAAILDGWLQRKDPPGTWTFDFRVVAEVDRRGVVEGITRYQNSEEVYANLWIVDLDAEGRCHRFVEYYMLVPDEMAATAALPE